MRGYTIPLLLAALLAAPLFWRLDLEPDFGPEQAEGTAAPEAAAPSVLLGARDQTDAVLGGTQSSGAIRLLTVIPTGPKANGSATQQTPAAILLSGATATK